MLRLILLFLAFLALPLRADPVPPAVLDAVRKDPEPFLTLATNLIRGFGHDGRIEATGIDHFVALERAAGRAAALRRLQLADLDFDGAVTKEEMEVLAASTAAKSRGRLWAMFEAADTDSTGWVEAGELMAFGKAEAVKAFSAGDEAMARAVLMFDSDADGAVTLEEVRTALAALGI